MIWIGVIAILEALYIGYLKNRESLVIEKLNETIKDLLTAINELMKDYEIKDASKYLKKIRNVKIEMK
ncbi:MAG: hypothetical protein Q4B56_01740 [Erysipelotrichaceae bacterium]|nr:hypothetical protein [Erysipelotrichaceae bacterium]